MSGRKRFLLPQLSGLIRHLFLAYLCAALVEYMLLPQSAVSLSGTQCLSEMSLPRLLIITGVLTIVLCFLFPTKGSAIFERFTIATVFLLLSAATLYHNFSWPLVIACGVFQVILVVYGIFGYRSGAELTDGNARCHWLFPVIVAILAIIFTLIVSVWTVSRVLSFSAPCFDFGIFSQMFHNMRATGLPMTTVERDGLLSHFAVHVSPIYYLMLPVYWLFPSAKTLQILQAVILASAVIPMWLIGKQRKLSGLQRTLLCAIVLFLPTTAGGTSYDLHENCFLLPLILWLMYAFDRRSIWMTLLFAVLTLAVKEDAAVYVAVAAIYVILRTALNYDKKLLRDMLLGLFVLFLSLSWFFLVTNYLSTQGDGVMTYRYDNFIYDGSESLFCVVKAVLLCPMKVLAESVEAEKLPFIYMTLFPLLGLPLVTRKYDRFLLLIPYILINLMSDYQYQHNIFFQYNFGSTAFLLYLCAINLADIRWKFPRFLTAVGVCGCCLILFCTEIIPTATDYHKLYQDNRQYYTQVQQTLDTVPEDASVTAHTFYCVPLSQRSELYDIRYCSNEHLLSSEYVVVKATSTKDLERFATDGKTGHQGLVALLEENDYTQITKSGSLEIYQKATP